MAGKQGGKVLILGGMTDRWHRFIRVGPLFQQVLRWHGFESELTEDVRAVRSETLEEYDVFVNYSTRREIEPGQFEQLKEWIEGGGGHVVLHGSAATFTSTPGYYDLTGAEFIRHPPMQPISVEVVDASHPIVRGLPARFDVVEEPYLLNVHGTPHMLMEGTYEGGRLPVAWVKDVGKGRLFYLALGHDLEQWRHPYLQYLLVRGVQWAAGMEPTF